jgi:hypothetical protein
VAQHPLDDSLLVAARAKQQFDALQAEIVKFAEDNPIALSHAINSDTGDEVLKIGDPPRFPRRWGVLLGEVVDSSVKALNYLVIALVREAGGQPDRQVAFPIAETRDAYFKVGRGGKTFRDRRLAGVPLTAAEKIDDLQPWHAGESAYRQRLAVLQMLRDAAEHHDLQAAYLSIDTPTHAVRLPMEHGEVTITFGKDGGIGVETQIKRLPVPGLNAGIMIGPKVDVGNRLAFEPIFGTDMARLADLREIKKAVSWAESIVKWFRPDFKSD